MTEQVHATDATFEAAGYELIATGGGCTAWYKLIEASNNGHILITCLDGCGHFLTDDSDKFIIGFHWEDESGNAAWSDCMEGATADDAIKAGDAVRLAWEFTKELRAMIGRVGLAKTVATNKARNDSTCASHDHCDANMAMLYAYGVLFGTPEWVEDAGDESDTSGEDRWNAAWDFAKRNHFFTESN